MSSNPPTFDLDEWIARFPLDDPGLVKSSTFAIGDCCSLAYVEQIRSRLASTDGLGRSMPTDVFVFGLGEGPCRDVTKVGGTPYRPATAPWPMSRQGNPMTFLAQYQFSESRDFVGEIPGDMMLVFVDGRDLTGTNIEGRYCVEWQPLGIRDLVLPEDVPSPAWTFVTCYGIRHRTRDLVETISTDRLESACPTGFLEDSVPKISADELTRLLGMKIGGLPTLSPYSYMRERSISDKFLCSLAGICPCIELPYPWADVAEPIDFTTAIRDENNLCIADGFYMTFWLQDDSTVRCEVEVR